VGSVPMGEKMSIEKKFNNYGQEQIINNFDTIVKIGDKFLQVRLIRTAKWKDRYCKNPRFTDPMPRAKFINPQEDFCYLITRKDLMKLKEKK
jgi:hypothetical protein